MAKRRAPRKSLAERPYKHQKPIIRGERTYSNRRKQQVLLFVIHHRIPFKRNIYGEFIHPNRGLSNIEPVQEEGYRRTTISEATEYFKIQNRSTVSSWWADKELILGGGCEGTRWAWYTLVQGHKQFILDQ
jgi:hypothetical protein